MKKMILSLLSSLGDSSTIEAQQPAPLFKTFDHKGKPFDLQSRKGQWTVLYFYPKAETPGCTKQACAFRDSIQSVRQQGAEVYGISVDTVEAQAAFHKNHNLNFDLLADAKGEIVKLYGTKFPLINISKRWTFIIDPQLKIAKVLKDVDPVADSENIAQHIEALKKA